MANQYTIYAKQFTDQTTLKNHTGSNTQSLCIPHGCPKCEQIFCSQRAMEDHRNTPTHRESFYCSVCKRPFGSKQALAQHTASSSIHARKLAKAKSTVGVDVDVAPKPQVVSQGRVDGTSDLGLTMLLGLIYEQVA